MLTVLAFECEAAITWLLNIGSLLWLHCSWVVGELGMTYPHSRVPGDNMGPTWGRQDQCEPHVGPKNFAIWVPMWYGAFPERKRIILSGAHERYVHLPCLHNFSSRNCYVCYVLNYWMNSCLQVVSVDKHWQHHRLHFEVSKHCGYMQFLPAT